MPGTTKDVSVQIRNGPGSLDLAVSYVHPAAKRRVHFVLDEGVKVEIEMHNPRLINHAEQSWLIIGFIHHISDTTRTTLRRGSKVSITYNAKKREGWIRLQTVLGEDIMTQITNALDECESTEFPSGFATFANQIGFDLAMKGDMKDAAGIWMNEYPHHAVDWWNWYRHLPVR